LSNSTSSHYCSEIIRPEKIRKKYPGDSCKSHEDCLKSKNSDFVGFCIDEICSGIKEDKGCKANSDCLAGLFCNGLYCEKQRKEIESCLDQYQCLNHLGCLNNTCAVLNSQYIGTNPNDNSDERLCQFNMLNKKTGEYYKISYYNMIPDDMGYVNCDIGQMCNYTNGIVDDQSRPNIIQQPCECGYNEEVKDIVN
jgi:hypothetical protein